MLSRYVVTTPIVKSFVELTNELIFFGGGGEEETWLIILRGRDDCLEFLLSSMGMVITFFSIENLEIIVSSDRWYYFRWVKCNFDWKNNKLENRFFEECWNYEYRSYIIKLERIFISNNNNNISWILYPIKGIWG